MVWEAFEDVLECKLCDLVEYGSRKGFCGDDFKKLWEGIFAVGHLFLFECIDAAANVVEEVRVDELEWLVLVGSHWWLILRKCYKFVIDVLL